MIFEIIYKLFFLNKFKNFLFLKGIISFIFSFIFNFILIKKFIIFSNKFNLIQKSKKINKILDKKVPTMGGIIIIISLLISIFIFLNIKKSIFYIILFTILSYGFLGFLDDYIKISKKFIINGLNIKYKYILQTIFTYILINFIYINKIINIKYTFIPILGYKNLYNNFIIFFIISYIVIMGCCNGINISDGIDGLSSNILINILYFIIISCIFLINNNIKFFDIFLLEEIFILSFILLGLILSFLWFNSYPSKIFMGDTGSLFLGSIIGVILILLKEEFLLFIVGFILIIELLSVILQIISIRIFKKKIFLMSPLHHHYQIIGIHDSKIVEIVNIISIILNFISLLILII